MNMHMQLYMYVYVYKSMIFLYTYIHTCVCVCAWFSCLLVSWAFVFFFILNVCVYVHNVCLYVCMSVFLLFPLYIRRQGMWMLNLPNLASLLLASFPQVPGVPLSQSADRGYKSVSFPYLPICDVGTKHLNLGLHTSQQVFYLLSLVCSPTEYMLKCTGVWGAVDLARNLVRLSGFRNPSTYLRMVGVSHPSDHNFLHKECDH